MGRKATLTNLTLKPTVGMAVVIKEVATGNLLRAATLSARDKEHAPICQFSGAEPFFKVKVGKKKGGFTYHTFKCAPTLPTCVSDDGLYEWANLTLKEARAQGLVIVNDTARDEESSDEKAAEAQA